MKNLIWILAAMLLPGCVKYSEGTRTGTLVKFSYKGISCKTWEGVLDLGGMRRDGEGHLIPNYWRFSIDGENSEDLKWVPAINEAIKAGKRVDITYSQELFASPCRGDSKYYVKGVGVAP